MDFHSIVDTPSRAHGETTMRHLLLLSLLSGCATTPWVPLTERPPTPDLVLVWVGRGECERLERGAWVRAPEFDYEFSVEQRRAASRWSSIKSLRRLHPDYDGSAGPRTQTYFFELTLGAAAAAVPLTIVSSLGDGVGTSDPEFRDASLELKAPAQPGAPFDRYRITQRYDYEGGALTELVELNQGKAPWVRNREVATLFAAHRFEAPPTGH